jgi:hypothetical protein
MGSIRGIVVINTNLPVDVVYLPIAVSLLALSVYGYGQRFRFKGREMTFLKSLLKLNLLLGGANVAIDLALGAPIELTVVYMYIAPYVIFLLMRMPSRYLHFAFVVIAIAISYSVCANFIESLGGMAGYEKMIEYNKRLRPDVFRSLSHTGGIYRAGGYTGSYHDSANILGMLLAYLLVRYVLRRNPVDLALTLMVMLSLTFTQSAANIALSVFSTTIFACYLLYVRRSFATYVFFFLGLAFIGLLISFFWDAMGIFTARLGKDGDWETMLGPIGVDFFVSEFPYVLAGHGTAFGSPLIGTEVAHINILGQLGILHAAIFFWILLYPVYRLVRSKSSCLEALPSAAAVFFGFLSLLHYNSLLRVTSIFLFLALYAICMRSIADSNCNEQSDRDSGTAKRLPPT